MRIERFDTIEDFRSHRAAWDIVYERDPEAQFFLSWQWLAGVLERYPGQWFVLVARGADGACLGYLPLRMQTYWSKSRECLRTEVYFAGRLFWADYSGIICLPEQEEAVLVAFGGHLKQMNWSHLFLKEFRISDRRFALFMAPFADARLIVEPQTSIINDGATNNLLCPYIDLPATFEAYLTQKLSANTRQKIRRFLRKLESSAEYRITTTSADTQSRDVRILEALWSKMWSKAKGSDTPQLAEAYGTIVLRGMADDLVRMCVLWHGDDAVGVLASFVDWQKSRLLFFVTGRDEDFLELPVGLVLHADNIRWAIENGFKTYDFLRGNEPYKYSLGAVDARLQYERIRTRSGVNLNGGLDPGCIDEAWRLAEEFAKAQSSRKAIIACRQILAERPGHQEATQLLSRLTGEVSLSLSETGAIKST